MGVRNDLNERGTCWYDSWFFSLRCWYLTLEGKVFLLVSVYIFLTVPSFFFTGRHVRVLKHAFFPHQSYALYGLRFTESHDWTPVKLRRTNPFCCFHVLTKLGSDSHRSGSPVGPSELAWAVFWIVKVSDPVSAMSLENSALLTSAAILRLLIVFIGRYAWVIRYLEWHL